MIQNEQIIHYQCPICERIYKKKMPYKIMNIIDEICGENKTPFYCRQCSKGNKKVWLEEFHLSIVIGKTPTEDIFNQLGE